MVRFGWFETDGTDTRTVETSTLIPVLWQVLQPPGVYGTAHVERDHYTYEGYIPLENTAALALHAELDPHGLWEVVTSLWVPCPIHPRRQPDQARCEYAALRTKDGKITNASDCGGFTCPGCWHGAKGITSDPGDEEEFFAVLTEWSKLEVVPNYEIPDHEDIWEWEQRLEKE